MDDFIVVKKGFKTFNKQIKNLPKIDHIINLQ